MYSLLLFGVQRNTFRNAHLNRDTCSCAANPPSPVHGFSWHSHPKYCASLRWFHRLNHICNSRKRHVLAIKAFPAPIAFRFTHCLYRPATGSRRVLVSFRALSQRLRNSLAAFTSCFNMQLRPRWHFRLRLGIHLSPRQSSALMRPSPKAAK